MLSTKDIELRKSIDMIEDISIIIFNGILKNQSIVKVDLSNYNFSISESYSIISQKLDENSYKYKKINDFLFIFTGNKEETSNMNDLILAYLKTTEKNYCINRIVMTIIFSLIFFLLIHFTSDIKLLFSNRTQLIGNVIYSNNTTTYIILFLYSALIISSFIAAAICIWNIIDYFKNKVNISKENL